MTRDDRITSTLPVVRQEAKRAHRRVPKHVELADLYSAGVVGLVTSADRWDEATNVPFSAFARRRIRGAILDYMREQDVCSRAERRHARATGTDAPVLTVSLESWLVDVSRNPYSTDQEPSGPLADRPDVLFELSQRRDLFDRLLAETPMSQRRVLRLLAHHPAVEVARLVGLTDSRVSQIKSAARERAVALGLV